MDYEIQMNFHSLQTQTLPHKNETHTNTTISKGEKRYMTFRKRKEK
jgi:hypothetical protein